MARSSLSRSALAVVAVASAYAIAGRLALLMAIPPGYATAIWPAAGVAFVAVLLGPRASLLGVLLGSFVVNVGTGYDGSSAATIARSVAIAFGIGLGAAVQSWLAVYLVRRVTSSPMALDRGTDILQFITRAGPIACTVAASWGVGMLGLAGIIRADAILFTWCTWWVGDVIGTLLVAPVLLAFVGRPERVWRPRRLTVALPLATGFVVVAVLFSKASEWEATQLRTELLRRAGVVERSLERQLERQIDVSASTASFYEASTDVTRSDFEAFGRSTLARHRGIEAISWVSFVPGKARAGFERPILERSASGVLSAAGEREAYYPVTRIAPAGESDRVLGFDLGSEPTRLDTIRRAIAARGPAISPPLELVQRPEASKGMLILVPVFRDDALLGLSSSVVRTDALMSEALAGVDRAGLVLRVEAGHDGRSRAMIYDEITRDTGARISSTVFELAGTSWIVTSHVSRDATRRSWQAWFVLAGGLAFVTTLGAVLLVVTGREARSVDTERDQRFVLALNDALRATLTPDEAAEVVTRRLGEHLQVSRCFFVRVDLERDRATIRAGYHTLEPIDVELELSAYSSSTQTELREGRTVVIDDALTDARTRTRYESVYAPWRLRALIGVPLLVDGRWKAALWATCHEPRAWTPEEVTLVQTIAERAWTWDTHLLHLSLLEERVADRTRALSASLAEKDVLLREIHHRVKNNLQVITSLLGLQASNTENATVRSAIGESRDRIHSIALVHDQLYRIPNAADIDMATYLDELVTSIERSIGTAGKRIELRVQATSCTLPLDQAIPCGLIVNELVTNAMKHGFRERPSGTITVTAVPTTLGNLRLTIADDGAGLPEGFDPASTRGLGMVVVKTLAAQLGASLTVSNTPGATFSIEFRRRSPAPDVDS